MSAIAGVLRLDGATAAVGTIEEMATCLAHRGPDGRGVWHRDTAALAHLARWTTPEAVAERQPLHDPEARLTLTADARIDNRQELLTLLAPWPGPPSEISDARMILAAYRRWGSDCALRLIGDFAFALWDGRRQRLLLARDHIGARSLYYHHEAGRWLAFASEIKALFAMPGLARRIDERRVAEHLLGESEGRERTFYRGVRRLPAAHTLEADSESIRQRRYWKLDPRLRIRLRSDAEYEEAFRERLTEAVRCRLRSPSAVGSTLSGGLDSSAVACVARPLLSTPLHTFSAVFPDLPESDLRRIDERLFVEAVLADGGFVPHRIRADRLGPLDELSQVLRSLDEPHVPFNLYLHRGIYRAADEQRVRVVLDGFDGDTTVSHGLFRLTELAVSLRWRALLREARAVARRSPNPEYTVARVLRGYAVEPLLPAPLRRMLGRRASRSAAHARAALLGPGVARHLRHLDQREPPAWRFLRGGRGVHLEALENPRVQSVLELAEKTAAACRVEARYPFFDRRLMEFCLALPAEQKLRDGWTRSILRRASAGILPEQVRWRTGKADLSPNFRLRLQATCAPVLDPILEGGDARIARFVELDAVSELRRRFLERPRMAEGLRLFTATTLVVWLERLAEGSDDI